MSQLRQYLLLLIAWAFLLGCAAASGRELPLGSAAAYLALAALAMGFLLPRRACRSWSLLLVPPLFLFVGGKAIFRFNGTGPQLFSTLFESGAIAISIVLARRLADGVEEFYEAVSHVVLPGGGAEPHPFESVQSHLYREVRRARLARQPLTLMTVCLADDSRDACDRLTEEALRTLSREYAHARVAELMRQETPFCDLVARVDQHLVTILPVAAAEQVAGIIERWQAAVQQQLGVPLAIGKASFPTEEMTLVGLLQHAEAAMHDHRRVLQATTSAPEALPPSAHGHPAAVEAIPNGKEA